MRRTKIVCTIGPSTARPEQIRALIEAGMNVARLNFSHGSHSDHRKAYEQVRQIAADTGRNVAIMMDLQGPKIRTGTLKDGPTVPLTVGNPFCITTRGVAGDETCVSTTYEHLPYDVQPGDRILLADGALEVHVERVEGQDVHCVVFRGGELGEHKGINLPGVQVSAPSLTAKDIEDLAFGLDLEVDYVALSFVRTADDIHDLKKRIATAGKACQVVAKIERPEAIDAFDQILGVTDAVMVARGDLGVEINLEDVPQVQKDLIQRCNDTGTPVITATQMLESMIHHSRPTRAEANDVANAIYDGTDAVMLSGETATGRYPIQTVRVMAEIAEKADMAVLAKPRRHLYQRVGDAKFRRISFSDAIGQAVSRTVQMMNVRRIVCFTKSGYTASAIARYRPNVPITALSLHQDTVNRCALLWGVEALPGREVSNTDDMLSAVEELLIERKLGHNGDTIIVVAGIPLGIEGRTNMLKLHKIGDHVR